MGKGLRYIFFEKDLFPWLHWSRSRRDRRWKYVFLQQLASYVDAGIDLNGALEACSQEGCPRAMEKALSKVKAAVAEGQFLSDALKEHAPKLFPKPYYAILEIGEKSGRFSEALKILSVNMENMLTFKYRMMAVLQYPILLFIVSIVIIFTLLVRTVPVFMEVFSDLGGTLPFPTRVLINLSIALRSHIFVFIFIVLCAALGLVLFLRLARRSPFDKLLFRFPLFGPILYHSNLFCFSSLMSMLLGSGAPTVDALSLCDSDVVWPVFRDAIKRMRRDVSEGRPFSDALAMRALFSPTFVWLTSVGEQKGDLADSLRAVSDYEMSLLQDSFGRVRLFEPVIVLMMSFMIGFVVMAMALPVFKLSYLLY